MIKWGRLLFILIISLVVSCTHKDSIDVSQISIEQEFKRFDQDLFLIPLDSIWDYVPVMQDKYPRFFELYNTDIVNIGSSYNFNYDAKLSYFLTDIDIRSSFRATQEQFKIFPFKKDITNAFKRLNYYFPQVTIPDIYTHISGFNQSIIIDSAYLSISLDKYLGVNSKYYQMLRTPQYLMQNMHANKIPSDVVLAFMITEFPNKSINENLISSMVYHGKIQYAMELLLPNTADSLLWGFSDKKLKWCYKNERQMWMYLIENKQLFSSAFKDIIRYIEEGPFTAVFSKESPSRTGRWLGYRIVKSYMKHNKKVTLEDLFLENDHQKILNESKYKP